jgi:hypothetical protein
MNRNLPLALRIKVLLSGAVFWIGFIFFAFGTVIFSVFAMSINFSDLKISKTDPTVKGRIIEVSYTQASENEKPIYEYQFLYSVNGEEFRNSSYDIFRTLPSDSTIEVIYSSQNPQISKIKGMRAGLMPLWVLLLVGIFPTIGFLFLLFSTLRKIKILQIMRVGLIAQGTLTRQEPTNTRINNRTVYKLFFSFTALDGQKYEAVGSTHLTERLTDEKTEMLVYDPQKPTDAVMLDVLPSVVKKYFQNEDFGFGNSSNY